MYFGAPRGSFCACVRVCVSFTLKNWSKDVHYNGGGRCCSSGFIVLYFRLGNEMCLIKRVFKLCFRLGSIAIVFLWFDVDGGFVTEVIASKLREMYSWKRLQITILYYIVIIEVSRVVVIFYKYRLFSIFFFGYKI